MAARQINLILSRKEETPEERSLKKVAFFWSPVILVGYLIVLVVILTTSYFFDFRLSTVNRGIDREEQAISLKKQDEGLYVVLKQKVAALSQILSSRYDYESLFRFFMSFQNDNVKIQTVTLKEDGTTVLDVSAVDILTLDAFVTNLLTQTSLELITVELVSMDYLQETNAYQLVLSVTGSSREVLR